MMPPVTIRTTTVDLTSKDSQIPAYVAEPEAVGLFPAVIVIQEVFGVNRHIREVAERLAGQGYVAIAPHIYHRQAPDFEVGYTDADLALGRQYKLGTQAAELLSDVQGAIAYAYGQDHVKKTGVGTLGFCFGGHVAYLAAVLPEVKATATFYGAGITTLTPGGGAPTLTLTPQIRGTLYGFFGGQDPLISADEVDQIESALQANGIDHQIFRYAEATHGFFCDQRDSYSPSAAAAAWDQVLALFRSHL